MTKYEAMSISNKGRWKYQSGKYELKNKDGEITILFLKPTQVKFMEKMYSRFGYCSFGCLKHVHPDDFPKWERI